LSASFDLVHMLIN